MCNYWNNKDIWFSFYEKEEEEDEKELSNSNWDNNSKFGKVQRRMSD